MGEYIGHDLRPLCDERVGFCRLWGAAFGSAYQRVPFVIGEADASGERDGLAAARGDAHLEVLARGVLAPVEDETDGIGLVDHLNAFFAGFDLFSGAQSLQAGRMR